LFVYVDDILLHSVQIPIIMIDRAYVRMLNDRLDQGSQQVDNTNLTITSPRGQHVKSECPSCGAMLEYAKSSNSATQVQCYKCQAIVEFD
jgi:predicted RNA-binding Zn-ribbon protein involved in translation (DUF1610 family)